MACYFLKPETAVFAASSWLPVLPTAQLMCKLADHATCWKVALPCCSGLSYCNGVTNKVQLKLARQWGACAAHLQTG